MPRTKGSKNKTKISNDYASQIAEKQSTITSLTTESAAIAANIDTLKADLKEKKVALKKAEKEVYSTSRTVWLLLARLPMSRK